MQEKFVRYIKFFGRTDVLFYAILWLMFLLIAGTIAQAEIGLYQAQNRYFSSYIFMLVGVIPLPAGYSVMGVILIGLVVKLFSEEWRWNKAGTIIIHVGVLLLLIGGFITAFFSTEGNMLLGEGQTVNYVSDYHKRELAIIDKSGEEDKVYAFSGGWLQDEQVVAHDGLPFEIKINKYCHNCSLKQYDTMQEDNNRGMAKIFDLIHKKSLKEDEENRSGVEFTVSNAGDNVDGVYSIIEFMPVDQHIIIDGKKYIIELRKERRYLPFSIKLVDFQKQVYSGTNKAKSYQSSVIVEDKGVHWRNIIEMNAPLRYKGYTFFQSSFIQNGTSESSVLAIVDNAGRLFPYISSIIMCVGMLLHIFQRIFKNKNGKKAALVAVILLSFSGSNSYAAGQNWFFPEADNPKNLDVKGNERPENLVKPNYNEFALIPILHEGRVKTLDSFARHYLTIMYGKDEIDGIHAVEWLSELMLYPSKAYWRKSFNISNPDLVKALGLAWYDGHKYSFVELSDPLKKQTPNIQKLLAISENERTLAQVQLLRLYQQTSDYFAMSRSLSVIWPHFLLKNKNNAAALDVVVDKGFSYIDFIHSKSKLPDLMGNILEKADGDDLSADEQELVTLAYLLQATERDKDNAIFTIIPPQWDSSKNNWISPWGSINGGLGSSESLVYLRSWQEISRAYINRDSKGWNEAVKNAKIQSYLLASGFANEHINQTENYYNYHDPLSKSLELYVAAFILLLGGFLFQNRLRKWIHRFCLWSLMAGLFFNIFGIILRMQIMSRPPVATLYESIVFVAAISVLFAVIIELRKKDLSGLMLGSIIGSLLHFIGTRYAAEGDTMGTLVAVLDTNFWLATHVVAITIGYGCAIVAGTLGHIYLLLFVFTSKHDLCKSVYKNMFNVALIALFFSTLGTILGGIWADQSWGRFWGWDPKENGALLLVLWFIWVLHGQISKIINKFSFALCMIGTNVIVALAWFGVNLLGVGLHSYGFTSHIVTNLALFCGAELIFALFVMIVLVLKTKKMPPANN